MARVSGSVEAAREAALRFFAQGAPDTERDRLIMARALGSLFVAGAIVGLVSILTPHEENSRDAAIAAICAVAFGVGLFFILVDRHLPARAFPATCYGATLLISAALYLSDAPEIPYAFYYVLIAMFAAYFLSVRQLV